MFHLDLLHFFRSQFATFSKKPSLNLKKNHFLALNTQNWTFLRFWTPICVWGLMGQLKRAFEVSHTRMGEDHMCMGRITYFFRSDTHMGKLIHVWAEICDLAFGVFMKIVDIDVIFHFPLVPRYSELRCSRYDQNITHLS